MAKAPDSVLLRLPARVWILLEEDEYETKFGDGRFLYATAAYWTESEATARLAHLKADDLQWRRPATSCSILYSIKALDLVRAGDGVAGDLKLGPDEHYTLEKVVELLSAVR
jgi:hypothetical protein